MMNKEPQRYHSAIVLGLGTSGAAAAELLRAEGARVVAVDRSATVSGDVAALERIGVEVHTGGSALPPGAFDVAILSPGVPADAPWVRELEQRGMPAISELELGWRRCRSRVLAVTGSNGKSTMVKLCCEALAHAGVRVVAGGNYGTPLSRLVLEQPDADWIVLEVSSFHLERVVGFRPDVGVLMNVYPNHLDRHGDLATYAGLKARLFARMGPADLAVFVEDSAGWVPQGEGVRRVSFGLSPTADCRYVPGAITFPGRWLGRASVGEARLDIRGSVFDNEILGLTAAAAVAAVSGCGGSPAHVADVARSFEPLPHRMQPVARIGQVQFVNNSKATNMAALGAALRMSTGAVRLIAGGLLKEKEFGAVKSLLKQKVRKAYLIGKAASVLTEAWRECIECVDCMEIEKAVSSAWREAQPGETILLAPGCASFDQFRNFEERGERFMQLVRNLELGKGEGVQSR